MCDNINLSVNCFESRNNTIIESLLEVDDVSFKKLSKNSYSWVPGRADRAHGGFVKIISEDSNDTYFKAFILPRTTKLSFQRENIVDKASNNEFSVMGNADTLNITIENKEVTYKLCPEKIMEPANEVPDYDVQLSEDKPLENTVGSLAPVPVPVPVPLPETETTSEPLSVPNSNSIEESSEPTPAEIPPSTNEGPICRRST